MCSLLKMGANIILLVISLQLCSSDLESTYKNLKFLEKVTDSVKDPTEFLDNLKATLVNPAKLEQVFTMFDASDFPEKKDWNREAEKKRFISVMTSEDDLEEKLEYVDITLKKLKISNMGELDEIFTMSESLEFVLDYYKNMKKVADESSILLQGFNSTEKKLNVLVKKKETSVLISEQICNNVGQNLKRYQNGEIDTGTFLLNEKYAEKKNLEDRAKLQEQALEDFVLYNEVNPEMLATLDVLDSTEKKINNIAQMSPVWGKHAFNVNIKLGLPAIKKIPDQLPVQLDILNKLMAFYVKIEGLKNLVLLEKDPSEKDKLEEDVEKEEELLADFLDQNTTTEQILNIVPATGILLAKATENIKAAAEIRDGPFVETLNKYKELTAQHKKSTNKYADHVHKLTEIINNIVTSAKQTGKKIEL